MCDIYPRNGIEILRNYENFKLKFKQIKWIREKFNWCLDNLRSVQKVAYKSLN